MRGQTMRREGILAQVGREPLDVEPALCSVSRHKKAACRQCVEVCPEGLLAIGEFGLTEKPDLSRCTGCGLCATVCPNGVFELKEPSHIALLRRIKLLLSERETLVVGCSAGAARGRHEDHDLTLQCVGRLNQALLVAAAAMGAREIVLKTYDCQECDCKAGTVVIERLVARGRELLGAFGSGTRIVVSEEDETVTVPGAPDGLAMEEPRGRREFLTLLKSSAFAVAGMVTDATIRNLEEMVSSGTEEANREGLVCRVPRERQTLIHFLRRLGEPQVEQVGGALLPSAQVHVDGNCSLCDCCSRLCPTGALRSTTDRGAKALTFFPSLCTGCGVCRVACLDGAVRLSDTVAAAALVEDRGETLIVYPTYRCGVCGETFGAPEPKRYCQYCEKKMKLWNVP